MTLFEYLEQQGKEEIRRIAELREKWEMDRASEIWYERNEARKEVAKEMKKKGIAIETICEVTKLTKEEIEKIEN